MAFSFNAEGRMDGYILPFINIIRSGKEMLETKGKLDFTLPAGKCGYPGDYIFNIDPANSMISVENCSGDPTRISARLKACARALYWEELKGRFRIYHKGGQFVIVKIPVA